MTKTPRTIEIQKSSAHVVDDCILNVADSAVKIIGFCTF